jgi:DNA polymerase-1
VPDAGAAGDVEGGVIKHPSASLAHVYAQIDRPFVEVLTEMQTEGVLLDRDRLLSLGERINHRLAEIQTDLNSCAGREINLRSNPQVQDFLFGQLALPRHPSKKLRDSANKEVLEWLRGKHLAVDFLLEYRKLEKLRAAFVDALPQMIDANGLVHPTFNNTVVETGRLSCKNPNVQQIPKRIPAGTPPFVKEAIEEIRKAFVAPPGHVIMKADLASAEFRIIVVLGGDTATIEAIKSGVDIHSEAVSLYLNRPYDEVVKARKAGDGTVEQLRNFMKNVVYGAAYGQTEQGLYEFAQANGLPMSLDECRRVQGMILRSRPGILRYIAWAKKEVLDKGYVDSYFGRRMWYPEAIDPHSPDWMVEKVGREATNAPIQATQADLMKMFMIRLQKRMRMNKMKARFLMQIHDEFVARVPEDEVSEVKGMAEEEVKGLVDWPLGMDTEVGVGPSWGEAGK